MIFELDPNTQESGRRFQVTPRRLYESYSVNLNHNMWPFFNRFGEAWLESNGFEAMNITG